MLPIRIRRAMLPIIQSHHPVLHSGGHAYFNDLSSLEAAPIGWQLFVLENGKSDSIAF
jgi:hypothetical protein